MTKYQIVELCTDTNKFKVTNWKERPKNTGDWELSIIKGMRSALDCSAIKGGGGE
jgi:hypothetical protein